MAKAPKWYSIPTSQRMTDGEYRANINGINMVLGAVLGFILAGAEGIPTEDFLVLLFFSMGAVISILYLSMSPYRLFYTLLTAAIIALLPDLLDDVFAVAPLPKLQPTLVMWAATVLVLELLPREQKGEAESLPAKEKELIE